MRLTASRAPDTRRGRRRLRTRVLATGVALVTAAPFVLIAATGPAIAQTALVGQGFNLNASDLRFILKQIKISEEHVRTATSGNPCGSLLGSGPDQIPNQNGQGVLLPWGLRTVDGTCNNLTTGRTRLGAADNTFPRVTDPRFRNAENVPTGFGPPGSTSYTQKRGSVFDSQPRLASNLIVDQTAGNPAAVDAAGEEPLVQNDTLLIPNTAPDVGLSAPYNSIFTIFGQFFDHGLDLTNKSGGTVFMPLKADDPLFNPAPGSPNFMVLTRATNQPGPDGILGDPDPAAPDTSLDDVQDATNQTSTFVDQSQTYTSHPSHQVFLREYADNAALKPVSTGRMLTGPGDGLATWESTKAQAAARLGIALGDKDVFNVPLLAADPYGKFIPGPNGYPQLVVPSAPGGLVEGNPAAPVTTAGATKTNHAFLDDIAHHAAPSGTKTPDRATGPDCILLDDPDTAVDESADNAPDGITPATGAQCAGTYDDEMLNVHFVAGDGRLNENIALSAVHQVFHSEHNRLVGDDNDEAAADRDIKSVLLQEDPTEVGKWKLADGSWNGEYLFQAARFVTEMEYQHLAFEEFARKVQPMINVFSGYDTSVDPAIVAEFAHSVYRFGHSMLNETVPRTTPSGTSRNIDLLDAFLNPPAYAAGGLSPERASGDIVRGLTNQVGNELDEFVTEALRNRLLGLPLDLASLNMARGRDTGIPSLNGARRQFFAATNQTALAPYANWLDFGLEIKHPTSLINFVAAYGRHPTILTNVGPDGQLVDDPGTGADETADNGPPTLASRRVAAARLVADNPLDPNTPADSAAFMNGTGAWANANGVTTTGLDDVDLWVGGLAEKQAPFGGLLGSSFNFIFETQMENLQDGDRFYYLSRTAGLNLLVQLEGNSFSELITRNTDAVNLPADVFSRPDLTFDLSVQGNTPGTPIVDDDATVYDERTLLSRMTDGTVRYAGALHVVFNGSADPNNPNQDDRGRSSEGDDTLRGNNGDDRFEGSAGNDHFIGGLGQDILTDSFGDDVLKGGDGNDALSSGPGFDLNQSGRGNDFVVGGSDPTETFGGPGDDFIFGGDSTDTVFGDDGNDWIEGGGQADLLQGDNGAPFQDDPNEPGHDVINGNGGADDYDSEGGDDIMVSGAGVERNEGMLGFDWVTHKNETAGAGVPVNADDDLRITGLLPPSVETFRDRFDLVESLSGWDGNDTLRGDDFDALTTEPGNALTTDGIGRITGLAGVLPAGATSFTGGNIILGGAGSDRLEGRGGNDIIDGNRWLNVQLRAPNLATADLLDTKLVDNMAALHADVFAGRLNPGDISIVRSIDTATAPNDCGVAAPVNCDTALFTGPRANYTLTFSAGQVVVTQTGANVTGQRVSDGIDTLRNMERLQFSNQIVELRVPNAPTITSATAGNANATVTWTAPAANGGPAITSYEIVATPTGAGTVVTRTGIGSTVRTATISGLTNGTTYTLQVRAVNAIGQGPLSAASNPVTPQGPPGAPTAVIATRGNTTVDLTWVAPASDGGSPITGYVVQIRTGTTVFRTDTLTGAGTSTTIAGLTNGTAYNFRVAAVNALGTGAFSASSNTVTPATTPGAPTIGTATAGNASATVTWTAPADTGGSAITSYQIVATPTGGGTVVTRTGIGSTIRTATITGLANGTEYTLQVRAVNAVGPGQLSAASNPVTPATVPGAPTAVTATRGDTTVALTWVAPASNGGSAITGYNVQVRIGTTIVRTINLTTPATSTTVTGLTNGTAYNFRVQAVNAVGAGAFATSNTVTPATVPGAPEIGLASSGAAGGAVTATATWAAPASNGGTAITGYRVAALPMAADGTTVAGSPIQSAVLGAAVRSFVFGLPAGDYRFEAVAINAVGTSAASARSNLVTAR